MPRRRARTPRARRIRRDEGRLAAIDPKRVLLGMALLALLAGGSLALSRWLFAPRPDLSQSSEPQEAASASATEEVRREAADTTRQAAPATARPPRESPEASKLDATAAALAATLEEAAVVAAGAGTLDPVPLPGPLRGAVAGAAGLFAGSAPRRARPYRLGAPRFVRGGGAGEAGWRLRIPVGGRARVKLETLSAPPRTVIDVLGATWNADRFTLPAAWPVARRIRVGVHADFVRLVVDLEEAGWRPFVAGQNGDAYLIGWRRAVGSDTTPSGTR